MTGALGSGCPGVGASIGALAELGPCFSCFSFARLAAFSSFPFLFNSAPDSCPPLVSAVGCFPGFFASTDLGFEFDVGPLCSLRLLADPFIVGALPFAGDISAWPGVAILTQKIDPDITPRVDVT